MKQTIIILTFALFGLTNLKAQTSFNCTLRVYCYWNDSTKDFDNCTSYEENSLFVMNKAETIFTHTNETSISTFYVQSKEYDEKNDVYTYEVRGDTGYKYYFVFDVKNKQVRIAFKAEGETILLTYLVKSIFQ